MSKHAVESIPEGAIFMVTRGQYSGFGVMTICRAKKPIDVAGLLTAWELERREITAEQSFSGRATSAEEWAKSYGFNPDKFLAMLLRDGYAEEIPHKELYLSGYGEKDDVGCWDGFPKLEADAIDPKPPEG